MFTMVFFLSYVKSSEGRGYSTLNPSDVPSHHQLCPLDSSLDDPFRDLQGVQIEVSWEKI